MFEYPPQATFNRVLPKSKIYEHGRPSNRLKKLFVEQVEKIVWKYKLAPNAVNLPKKKSAPEIEVFEITLRTPDLREDVLRCIDKAISFPIFYELVFEDRFQSKAAYKRPSEADSDKWVVDVYFESAWKAKDMKRKPLPVALDMGRLYEQMLQAHISLPVRKEESVRQQVERMAEIRLKQTECDKLQKRMGREKQYNRKVELNSQVRELKQEIKRLEK